MGVRLIAQNGQARGQALEIKAPKFFIGTDDHCQLRPGISGLARIHALIEDRDGLTYIRDFGAEPGTVVNDRHIHMKEVELFDGDLIRIGPMELQITISSRREDTPALREVPVGWPFLEPEAAPPPSVKAHAAPEPVDEISQAVIAQSIEAPAPAAANTHAAENLAQTRAVEERPIRHEVVGEVLVVRLIAPDLNDEFTVGPLRAAFRDLLDQDLPRQEILDMSEVNYMSSRAVGVVLAHSQGLRRLGGTMRVCGAQTRVNLVLKQMHLDTIIDTYDTLEEARADPWS